VRRDHADIFCTTEEGIAGERAVDWRLVDECARRSEFDGQVQQRALAMAEGSDRPADQKGIQLAPLERKTEGDSITYSTLRIELDRELGTAEITLLGPAEAAPKSAADVAALGAGFWPLALARDLDDAILHLRFNELEVGSWIFKSAGEGAAVQAYDKLLEDLAGDWLVREITLYWKRTLKRLDVTSRSLLAFVEPGSCFSGFLSEILFAADRIYMLEGTFEDDNRPPPAIELSAANFGTFPMPNGITRLAARFYGEPKRLEAARGLIGVALDAAAAEAAGLVTFALDDIDWEDEIRLLLEERMSYSPDALTGMEANLRFVGPETAESKIFGRLTAWQNWIFQRPNAAGEKGALRSYGSGERPELDKKRV
jgi:benzoyl-CoA-dihydrodiol lyase